MQKPYRIRLSVLLDDGPKLLREVPMPNTDLEVVLDRARELLKAAISGEIPAVSQYPIECLAVTVVPTGVE